MINQEVGRVPLEPGSRASTEPVYAVSAASGFDPSRVPFSVREAVRIAISDPGSVVGARYQSNDGAIECLQHWQARSAIAAFVSAQARRHFVSVPLDAPEAMWDGLPRQIMMWLDFSRPTPRSLFQHLDRCGIVIPDWLREEGELKALDHVPSKGTRCVLIYRAMVENWLASAIEAQRAETAKTGSVHESAVPKGDAENAPNTPPEPLTERWD